MRLLGRLLPVDRYGDLKNGAIGARLDEPQCASVVCDQPKTDSESQPHTARFCRKERMEYALSILDRNAGSGVLDRQQYACATIETRCEPQASCPRGHGAHCVDSVLDKVQKYLLELRGI